MGRTKRARRLGSGSGEFTGDGFLVFFFGEIGIGATARRQAGITGHEPQSLGHSPFLSKCHFAESLNLNGMEWLELHRVGILDKINRIYKIRERRGVNELGVNGGEFCSGGEFLVRRRGNKGFLFCRCAAITPAIMGLF
jgi:hypothetical protein